MKAVIDLGTNTFHLLIAELKGHDLQVLHKQQIPVKMGRGGVHKNTLTNDAIARAMDALQVFWDELQSYAIQSLAVYGTAAIRDADNGAAFIQEVYNRFGFRIQAISGEQEAEFIFKGVQAALPAMHDDYIIMDIGGGSVEFIIVKENKAVWKQSFRTGASRLIQTFSISDPLSTEEIEALQQHFKHVYQPLIEAAEAYQPRILAGSAGSFETLKEVMVQDMHRTTIGLTPNAFELPMNDVNDCLEMLIHSTQAQRAQLKGMASFRMEMIATAALMTRWVIHELNIQRVIMSYYSLKEGALLCS